MTKIDVVSGFLGAGKTTLIKKLLKEALAGTKVVLIENEFGEIRIDGGFLKESGIEIKEMNSGCICCSLVGDFGTSLKEVIATYAPERILIEPSGVGKLSDVLKAVENVAGDLDVQINSAVAVVDASKCKMYTKNFGEFFLNQIEYAGTVILTRADKASQQKMTEAAALVRPTPAAGRGGAEQAARRAASPARREEPGRPEADPRRGPAGPRRGRSAGGPAREGARRGGGRRAAQGARQGPRSRPRPTPSASDRARRGPARRTGQGPGRGGARGAGRRARPGGDSPSQGATPGERTAARRRGRAGQHPPPRPPGEAEGARRGGRSPTGEGAGRRSGPKRPPEGPTGPSTPQKPRPAGRGDRTGGAQRAAPDTRPDGPGAPGRLHASPGNCRTPVNREGAAGPT